MSRQYFGVGLDLYNNDIKDVKVYGSGVITDSSALTAYLGATFKGKYAYHAISGHAAGRISYRGESSILHLATTAELNIANLSDVNVTGIANKHILVYNSGTGKWVSVALSGDASIANDGVMTLNTVVVTKGGTGLVTIGQGDLLYGSATNTMARLPKSTTDKSFLKNSGTSNNPAWATIGIDDLSNMVITSAADANVLIYDLSAGMWKNQAISGDITITKAGVVTLATVPVTKGGTGLTTIAQGDLLYGSAENTIAKLAKSATANQFLKNSGGGVNNPAWATISYTDITGTPSMTFLALTDTPAAYTGAGNYILSVNASATAVDFISSLTKTQQYATTVYTDQANTYGDHAQKFRSGKLEVRNPANTFSYQIIGSAITANRELTIPLLTASDTLMTIYTDQYVGGIKTFGQGIKIELGQQSQYNCWIRTEESGQYDYVAYLPVVDEAGQDFYFVFDTFSQSLSNKIISADLNTLIGKSGDDAQGDILTLQTGKYQRKARGANGQVLKTASNDVSWSTVDWSELTGTQPAPVAHNLIDTTNHPVSGLTTGHFLKATGATTYAFAAHGLTTTDISEGTNLYFTTARVLATALTGYTDPTASATYLANTNTILNAFECVQAQIKHVATLAATGVKPLNPANVAFNNSGSALPTTTATTIDGQTVLNGWRVLIFDYLDNVGDDWDDGDVVVATVSGGNITWTLADEPENANTIWIEAGTVYSGTTWQYDSTAEEWIQTGGPGNLLAGNGINITNSTISLAVASAGWTILARDAATGGALAQISAGTDHHVLRRSGNNLNFGLLTNSNISTSAGIAWSKLASGTADRLLKTDGDGIVTIFDAGTQNNIIIKGATAPGWSTYVMPSSIAAGDIGKVLLVTAENTISKDYIANSNVGTSAGIVWSKLAAATANHVAITNSSGVLTTTEYLEVKNGGTGRNTLTAHSLLIGAGASQVALLTPNSTAYRFLVSAGVNAPPAWSQYAMPTTTNYEDDKIKILKATSLTTAAFEEISVSDLPYGIASVYTKVLVEDTVAPYTMTTQYVEHGFGGEHDYITDVMVWYRESNSLKKFNIDFVIARPLTYSSGDTYWNAVTITSNISWPEDSLLVITGIKR